MPKRGLEPPPGCPDQTLNLARLPIPPLRRDDFRASKYMQAYDKSQANAHRGTPLTSFESQCYIAAQQAIPPSHVVERRDATYGR